MSHTFPILPLEDILLCCSELNAPITLEVLKKPEYKDVKTVFERLIKSCFSMSEEVFQMTFATLQDVEHPELHEKSYAIRVLYMLMRKLTRAACIKDFSMTDIVVPEAKRLLFILSGIINYEKYRADKITLFDNSQDHINNLLNRRIDVANQQEEAELRLNSLNNRVHTESQDAIKLQQSNILLEKDLAKIKNDEISYNNKINVLHENLHIQQENNISIKSKSNESKNQVALLKEKTLPTIQELKITLAELSKTIENYKRDNTNIAQLSREFAPKVEFFNSVGSSLERRVASMVELEGEMVKINKLTKELNENIENCENLSTKVKELEVTEDHYKSQIGEIYEKSSKQKKQFENKKKKAQLAYEEVQLQKMQLNQELEDLILSINRIDTENNAKSVQLSNIKKNHEMDVVALNAAQQKMTDSIGHYHKALKAEF